MIPLIGMMIGGYIIIRMVVYLADREQNNIIKILAALQIMFVIFVVIQLFITGSDMASLLY